MKTFHEFHNELEELLNKAANNEKVEVQQVVNEIESAESLTDVDKQVLLTLIKRIKEWLYS